MPPAVMPPHVLCELFSGAARACTSLELLQSGRLSPTTCAQHQPDGRYCMKPHSTGIDHAHILLSKRALECSASPTLARLAWQRKFRVQGLGEHRTLGGCVRAVRGSKRVVDVDVGVLGQLLGKARVILLLLLVKAHVFQHQQLHTVPELRPWPRSLSRAMITACHVDGRAAAGVHAPSKLSRPSVGREPGVDTRPSAICASQHPHRPLPEVRCMLKRPP